MRIPLLSKKNKKILEKNQERLVDYSKEQQLAILNNPKIKLEDLNLQLLKENNELKLLLDTREEEETKKLRQGGSYVFEIGHGYINIIDRIKVLPDNKLKWKGREVDIRAKELVGRLKGSFGRWLQFRAWFVEPEGEYTYNPIDETPIELKKQNEQQLLLGHTAAEVELGTALMKDIGSRGKKWFEFLPWIVFGVVIFGFLIFMAQYNLVK